MNMDELRQQMESYRRAADEEAKSLKDSYLVLDRLHSLYQEFDTEERSMADKVLSEWVLSEDENLRFDALALIRIFKVAAATPALQKLASRLESSSAPGAPYELEKVNRLVGNLTHL